MKRTLFGIAVAAAALFSACETIEPQAVIEEQEVVAEARFTADLGVDTKTYLEQEGGVFKVRWAEGDHFTIYDANDMTSGEDVNLISGMGTSVGTFTGSLVADKYLAYYGYRVYDENNVLYPAIERYQRFRVGYDAAEDDYYYDLTSFQDYEYPMVAVSNTTNLSFKNIASVLKVSLVGEGKYIKNIVITPNDPTVSISGTGDLILDGDRPELVMHAPIEGGNFIQYDIETNIDPSYPFDCYVVLPAQKYTGGFTITINSSDGYMDVSTNADIVMEQSQIRAVPTITYEQEYTSEWGVCGSFTDWQSDVPMSYSVEYGCWILEDYYLEANAEFKFRANGDWAVNYGAYEYGTVPVNTYVDLVQGGQNMYVSTSGYYDLYLLPDLDIAYIMEAGLDPGSYYECSDYQSAASLDDYAYVKLTGYVMATAGRGFILNIGQYHNNCIYIYQGTDQSSYYPVLGNEVTVYATKITYNGLPEISDIQRIDVLDGAERDFGYGDSVDLLAESDFVNFYSDTYIYVKYSGYIEKSGNYYNVYVGDQREKVGSPSFPNFDMTPYLDQEVYIEGYFIGFSGGGKYLNTIIKTISILDNEGGTEDVYPGDDIPMTKASLRIK